VGHYGGYKNTDTKIVFVYQAIKKVGGGEGIRTLDTGFPV
jgi:hypothetical protein